MANPIKTKVRVSESCWQVICDELDRVAPREGIVVPLVAIDLVDPNHNPCANIGLGDIARLVIADVVVVPHDHQRNQLARVSVLAQTDEIVGRQIEQSLLHHPRLRACAHLHSHPFARGSTWPSRGHRCDYDGHMLPLLFDNRGSGLETSFSFIACRRPSGESRGGLLQRSGLFQRGWVLQCFALDPRARIVDLGFAQVVADHSPQVQAALHPPLHASVVARSAFRHWRRQQRRRGARVLVEPLFDGWVRAIAEHKRQPTFVALLPNDLPRRRPRQFRVEGHCSRELQATEDSPLLLQGACSQPTRVQQRLSGEEYFARVEPLLGEGLSGVVVAVNNVSFTARIVELLVGCRLNKIILHEADTAATWPMQASRWSVLDDDDDDDDDDGGDDDDDDDEQEPAATTLVRHLRWKNRHAQIDWTPSGNADVTLDGRLATADETSHIEWDAKGKRVTLVVAEGDLFAYRDLSYTIARDLRDILLQTMPWPTSDTWIGCDAWPFMQTQQPIESRTKSPTKSPTESSIASQTHKASHAPARAFGQLRALEGQHIMVVGCGSVGSEAIRMLANNGARWTLVDNGKVSVFNPLRQWFGSDEVGRAKVEILAERLTERQTQRLIPESVRPVRRAYCATHIDEFAQLLDEDQPDVVLLCTGTDDDACLAELLWQRAIPHLAAYAYPQARFFEVNTVLPQENTPCLHCLRGNLYRGASGAPRLTSEVEQFLYRDLDAKERATAYKNLVAEPASAIETGRIAEVLARCTVQAVTPNAQRERWFLRMLSAATTCLLGGNVVDSNGGDPAYGITEPGQVIRLGLEDIMGAADTIQCSCCGRKLDVYVDTSLPAIDDDDEDNMDLALLG